MCRDRACHAAPLRARVPWRLGHRWRTYGACATPGDPPTSSRCNTPSRYSAASATYTQPQWNPSQQWTLLFVCCNNEHPSNIHFHCRHPANDTGLTALSHCLIVFPKFSCLGAHCDQGTLNETIQLNLTQKDTVELDLTQLTQPTEIHAKQYHQ